MSVVVPTNTAQPARAEVAVAAELVEQIRGELPTMARLDDREQLLAAAWLIGLRSARTRRAYAADVATWLAWLRERDIDVLAATRVHINLWVSQQQAAGAADSTVCRRLSALSSFYRHCAAHDLIPGVPTDGVDRPNVDPDFTATIGLDRDQAKAFLAAADADTGPQRLRTAAAARLLLHNALRVDEACAADISDLSTDRGHHVLDLTRKGARRARVPLTPGTLDALHAYFDHRARADGLADATALSGPLLGTSTGHRLSQDKLWRLVRRLARAAGIDAWAQLSPHSLRHTAITLALDAGVSIRDVQDYAGHRDARTTRRYDHSRDSLDRNAAYAVAAYLS